MENDCTVPNFLLEQHIQQLTNTLSNKPFDDDNIEMNDLISEQSDTSQCTASVDVSTFGHISVNAIEEQISKEIEAASSNEYVQHWILDLKMEILPMRWTEPTGERENSARQSTTKKLLSGKLQNISSNAFTFHLNFC